MNRMKRYFKIALLGFLMSCTNNSNESKESILNDIQKDSSSVEKIEPEENASPLVFLEDDSIAFYNSTIAEEKTINEYCECAQKKGGTSSACRDFIKKLTVHQNRTDEILNKYLNSTAIFEKLNLRVSALNKRFNDCNNYPSK